MQDHEIGGDDSGVEEPASPPRAPKPRSSIAQVQGGASLIIKPKPKSRVDREAVPIIKTTVQAPATKEERALEAKYEQLRAAIEASKKVSCVTRVSQPAHDRMAAAVATLAKSNSSAADAGEGDRVLKRPSAAGRRRPSAAESTLPASAHGFPTASSHPLGSTPFQSDFPTTQEVAEQPPVNDFDSMWE